MTHVNMPENRHKTFPPVGAIAVPCGACSGGLVRAPSSIVTLQYESDFVGLFSVATDRVTPRANHYGSAVADGALSIPVPAEPPPEASF